MNKRLLYILLIFATPLFAQNLTPRTPTTFSSVPSTIEEFKALHSQTAVTPEGAAAMVVLAIHIYGKDPILGNQALVVSVLTKNRSRSNKPGNLDGIDLGNSDKYLVGQLDKYKMLSYGYWKGAEPANGYTPNQPLTVETFTNPYSGEESSGKIKLFVGTKGASSFRPITVEKDSDGLWRSKEFSSLFVGMQAAK